MLPPNVATLRTGLLALCLAAFATGQNDNVLLIVADDIGVDYVGAYAEGTNPPPTPNIDSLAANGVLFPNAWPNSSCSPSRACIMTTTRCLRTSSSRL